MLFYVLNATMLGTDTDQFLNMKMIPALPMTTKSRISSELALTLEIKGVPTSLPCAALAHVLYTPVYAHRFT